MLVNSQLSGDYKAKELVCERLLLSNSHIVFMFQRWARAYRDDKFHAAVDTNNGVEAMNKTLKYNYLPRGKNITVSQLVVTLTEEFLPEMLRKYQKQNILCQVIIDLTMILFLNT